jgi:hypothetical protein
MVGVLNVQRSGVKEIFAVLTPARTAKCVKFIQSTIIIIISLKKYISVCSKTRNAAITESQKLNLISRQIVIRVEQGMPMRRAITGSQSHKHK